MPLTTYYAGQKEENDVLCESRSEVCSVAEKSHNTKMHGLGLFSVKICCYMIYGRWWQNITWRYVSSEIKCFVAWQTVTSVWGSNLLQNFHNYLMTEITSCPRRNVPSSPPILESPILKYHLFGSYTKITNIYIEIINRIMDINLSFHYHTYYRSDLTEGYIVYSVCQSNTEWDIGKIHCHSK